MKTVKRRDLLLASLGVSASALLSGCSGGVSGGVAQADEPKLHSAPAGTAEKAWRYVRLDPAAVAKTAYRMYPEGGCMYAMVGSVVGTLAERVGEPFRSFPFEMMRYGKGGVGDWGSLCGVVNGGAALIGLFHNEKAKEQREELVTELCVWYETTPLPEYPSDGSVWAPEAKPSIAGSVLCHMSVARWSEVSGCRAFGIEKKERCRRLTADGARKTVEILNRKLEDKCKFAGLTPEVKSCVDCHGKKERADAMGKMNCSACHKFEKKHPTP